MINQSLLLFSAAGDLDSEDTLAAVDQISIVLCSTVFKINDRASLFVDLLGKLSLRPVLGKTSVLNGECAVVIHFLVLDLLVLIAEIVGISDG